MHPGQDRLAVAAARDVAVDQRDVLGAVDGDPVAVRREVAVPGGQPGLGDPLDAAPRGGGGSATRSSIEIIARPCSSANSRSSGAALHGAVVVDDLDEHAGRA